MLRREGPILMRGARGASRLRVSASLPAIAVVAVLLLIGPTSASPGSPPSSIKLKAPFTGAYFTYYNGPYSRGCSAASLLHPVNWSAQTGMGTFGVRSTAHPCPKAHPGTNNTSVAYGDVLLYITLPFTNAPAKLSQIDVYWRVLAQLAVLLLPGRCAVQPGHGQRCIQEAYVDVFSEIAVQDTTSGATPAFGYALQYWRSSLNFTDCTLGPCQYGSGVGGRGHLGDFKSVFMVNATLNKSHSYVLEVQIEAIAGTYFTSFGARLTGGSAVASFNAAKVGGIVLRSVVVR
ncbi:MAG: hypothetical protein L3K19_04115 [Thermoplasmata archaeon]|nr:hypothetical protein [Thermoplasmata archaeon]